MRLAKAATIGLALALVPSAALAGHGTSGGSGLSFTNTPLSTSDGGSEPAITIGQDGTMIVGALSWQLFQTNLWKGSFGSTPIFQGAPDANLEPGVGGGGDEDWDLASNGTLHGTTLIFFFNPQTKIRQLGVSAISCPNADTSNSFASCTSRIIDTTQADRQWVTSLGSTVWISYHDSGSSTLIHIQRSTDDGKTWTRVGDPIVGQGSTTGDSTFNNDQGELEADPTTGILYDVYAAGQASIQKGTNANFNQVFVSRSRDGGQTWTASLVFSAPLNTALNNVFPAIAVDPANGDVYATWSDAHTVSVAKSTDQGQTWSAPQVVSSGGATTAVFPAIAARHGVVDLSYYGSTASSIKDSTAVWNVFVAQSTDAGGSYSQTKVSDTPNHVGVICVNGIACAPGTRNLLDLFEDAIDPVSGKLAIIYTNDLLTTISSGNPLPQVELAQQN
ncbi:MAG TPA: sialidase family protein [Acidimicrobiales bacterium]